MQTWLQIVTIAGISTLLMRPGGAAVPIAAKGEKEPATVTDSPSTATTRPARLDRAVGQV